VIVADEEYTDRQFDGLALRRGAWALGYKKNKKKKKKE